MEKFKNKYRIASNRKPNWDYSKKGIYFITICTKNRKHFFGEIENAEMIFSKIGKIAHDEWLKTLEIRKDMNLQFGEFVVMPNHFHGIIIIGDNEFNCGRDAMHRVSTKEEMHRVSTEEEMQSINSFAPQSKNIASIIRGFKSAVTIQARKMGDLDFNWQSRFHDHIVRNFESFDRIQKYIQNNPKKWEEDCFSSKNK